MMWSCALGRCIHWDQHANASDNDHASMTSGIKHAAYTV